MFIKILDEGEVYKKVDQGRIFHDTGWTIRRRMRVMTDNDSLVPCPHAVLDGYAIEHDSNGLCSPHAVWLVPNVLQAGKTFVCLDCIEVQYDGSRNHS